MFKGGNHPGKAPGQDPYPLDSRNWEIVPNLRNSRIYVNFHSILENPTLGRYLLKKGAPPKFPPFAESPFFGDKHRNSASRTGHAKRGTRCCCTGILPPGVLDRPNWYYSRSRRWGQIGRASCRERW